MHVSDIITVKKMVLFYFNHGTSWETDVFFECAMVNFVLNSWEINNRWSNLDSKNDVNTRIAWESHADRMPAHGNHMKTAPRDTWESHGKRMPNACKSDENRTSAAHKVILLPCPFLSFYRWLANFKGVSVCSLFPGSSRAKSYTFFQ
jgi:hypothetical protein